MSATPAQSVPANDLLLRALRREAVERPPVWMMRQAGRYLPQYRAVRAKSDFLTMCRTPELAVEVTLQPLDLVGVDAAIIFSDILVIPEAMGMHLTLDEGIGPQFPSPLRAMKDLDQLHAVDPQEHLKYVLDALKLARREIDGNAHKALLDELVLDPLQLEQHFPLLPHQLKRIAARVPLGIGIVGGFGSNGSGDIFITFSTANPTAFQRQEFTKLDEMPNDLINPLFEATVQAVEEAIINAMIAAETMEGINGNKAYGLPHNLVIDLLRKYNRIK